MSAPDRLQELLEQDRVTGIDFVYVHEGQVTLDVYFLRDPATLETPLDVIRDQISIYDPSGSTSLSPVPLTADPTWEVIDERNALRLTMAMPGAFTFYKLHINHPRIDPYFNDVTFSFKVNCESRLDCKAPEHECPAEEKVDFPVDYRARDFRSFRRALLDFASLRYPDWKDRLEADAGIMLAEVMSALGDEQAYYQDRIAREAYLETATQRRSLRRHTRLVDYHVHDGLGALTWLDITVKDDQLGDIPAGMDIRATAEKGMQVDYEVGQGLDEIVAEKTYAVDSTRNTFEPHIWDEDDTCLFVGATELFIKGHHEDDLLPFDDRPDNKEPGKWVLLKTTPTDPAITERAWMIRLITIKNTEDSVFAEPITHLVWEKGQALPFEMDMTVLEVRANLLPATAGKMFERLFVIGTDPQDLELPEAEKQILKRAIERHGPNESIAYLFSLPGAESNPLVRMGDDPHSAAPELRLVEVDFIGGEWVEQDSLWTWRRSLLGTCSSQPNDCDFMLDDGTWRRVAGYQRIGKEIVHKDYASGDGTTIRFGDGEFGLIPEKGTVFKVTYRLGKGRRDNLPAGSLKNFDQDFEFIKTVTNPLPAENGMDAETHEEIRQLAPEAFRAIAFRAVRPEDYAEAAERLPWVQRADAAFRWTGSWLSAFATADPLDAVTLIKTRRVELTEQLDRFRQAGREVHVLDPRYADLDLKITICVNPDAYVDQVREMVLETLFGKKGILESPGFFSPDNFTFGTPLERPALEAAIQSVPGVRAVMGMEIHRRGWYDWRDFADLSEPVGQNEVIRIANDPLHPERGSIEVNMEGGA